MNRRLDKFICTINTGDSDNRPLLSIVIHASVLLPKYFSKCNYFCRVEETVSSVLHYIAFLFTCDCDILWMLKISTFYLLLTTVSTTVYAEN